MDKSVEFIKMCAEAKEIQKGVLYQGDYYSPNGNTVKISFDKQPLLISKYIWLPRQDQLQEIANICDCTDPMCLHLDFHKWYIGLPNPAPVYDNNSWEQLWLVFAMIQRFGKIWNGESWEKVN